MVVRVALGEAYRTTRAMPDSRRPPDDDGGIELDSVWADDREHGGCVDHREVIVYSKGQALPVALVISKRIIIIFLVE